jgi:hypothetical protein
MKKVLFIWQYYRATFGDDIVMQASLSTDTTIGEHRVDISGSDSEK